MVIPIEHYAVPRFVKLQPRYPMSYDKRDRFNEICPRDCVSRYGYGSRSGWKQPGYNPNHQSIRLEKIDVRSDDITLRPR